jgi:hypothetical protein
MGEHQAPMTDLTKLRADLRAGLDGVTPGPWYRVSCSVYSHNAGELAITPINRVDDGRCNIAHIARCSPDNIRALLEALDEAERGRDEARAEMDAIGRHAKRIENAERERDEAIADHEREADWNKYVDQMNLDGFDAAADRWLAMPAIQLMHNAAASVFSKWANDELMSRFKEYMTNIMHQSFVEGAIIGARVAMKERDEARSALATARRDALEEAAQLVAKYGYAGCERGQTDPTTGVYECQKEARGDCNCYEFAEAFDAIRALKDRTP